MTAENISNEWPPDWPNDWPRPWRAALAHTPRAAQWRELVRSISAEESAGTIVYPPAHQRFAALAATAPHEVRVVILGQDPYHGPGQAHGLAFSVPDGMKPPPSLANVFRELQSDLGIPRPRTGNLSRWARQGVLLLNTALSVEAGRAGSHSGRGWETLTDAVVRAVAERDEPSVFILWGSHAQKTFERAVKRGRGLEGLRRHLVLPAPHPSPLSAYRGFFGSRPFSRANAFLEENGRGRIDWALP